VAGTLYLVGTPIGNLGDLSERARSTLAAVDVVAAEDTRRTSILLRHIAVSRPLVSFFEGNEAARTPQLVAELRSGADVALVTDAGMPSVSDPGFRLVRASIEAGIDVRVVPGPSAVTAALVVSGLPTDRFVFEGFLPRRAAERRSRLGALAEEARTIVLFESPARVPATLSDALAALGDRRAAVTRELTKLHEEVRRGRLSELAAAFDDSQPKGEIAIVIEGGEPAEPSLDALLAEARELVAAGARKRDAAADVARRRGGSANEIYRGLIGEG
jgi:16S rRNA (cytidine1402-2'-O)-methyltransferase